MRDLTDEDTDIAEMLDADEFIGMVVDGEIGDEDGYFKWVFDEDQVDENEFPPSDVMSVDIPEDVTHVLWYEV